MDKNKNIIATGGVILLLVILYIFYLRGIVLSDFTAHIASFGCALLNAFVFRPFYIHSKSHYYIPWIRESYTIPFLSGLFYVYAMDILLYYPFNKIRMLFGLSDFILSAPFTSIVSAIIFVGVFSFLNFKLSKDEPIPGKYPGFQKKEQRLWIIMF